MPILEKKSSVTDIIDTRRSTGPEDIVAQNVESASSKGFGQIGAVRWILCTLIPSACLPTRRLLHRQANRRLMRSASAIESACRRISIESRATEGAVQQEGRFVAAVADVIE